MSEKTVYIVSLIGAGESIDQETGFLPEFVEGDSTYNGSISVSKSSQLVEDWEDSNEAQFACAELKQTNPAFENLVGVRPVRRPTVNA